jgi:hypothetical protein
LPLPDQRRPSRAARRRPCRPARCRLPPPKRRTRGVRHARPECARRGRRWNVCKFQTRPCVSRLAAQRPPRCVHIALHAPLTPPPAARRSSKRSHRKRSHRTSSAVRPCRS